MDSKFSIINYADAITGCNQQGITECREQEKYLAEKITTTALSSILILDFIGADHISKNPVHYQRILLESFERYEEKCGENLPIILFNIDEHRLNIIKSAEKLEDWLSKNKCLVPIISDYGELVSIMGIHDYDERILKSYFYTSSREPIPKGQLFELDDIEVFNKNKWLWEKDNSSYSSNFSPNDIVNYVATYVIKKKLRAIQTGHYQLLSGMHISNYISSPALYSRPSYTAWMARIIFSKFQEKNIDFIVFFSSQTLILALELREEFEKSGVTLECIKMENYYRPAIKHAPPYFSKFKDKKVLIIIDVLGTGKLLRSMIGSISNEGGKILGVASIVNGKSFKGRNRVNFFSLCKYPINLYEPDSCPKCNLSGEKDLLYVSPRTHYPTKLSTRSEVFNVINSGNEENVLFWQMVKKTNALKTHIRLRNVKHYYYYIDTNAILSRYIHEINWGLKSWYGEDKQPDIIFVPNHSSAIKIANHIIKKEFHEAELITAEKSESDGDYFSSDEKKLEEKDILIVDAGANTGETLIGLLNICKTNKVRNVKICIFLNRLVGDYRHSLESRIDPQKIKSIFRVPIPAFTTTSQQKCPLCNEIKQLKKYYPLMSPAAKEYIDKRLAKIKEFEYSNSESVLGGKTSERALKRVKTLDYLYGKGSTAFLDALRHSTSLKELWIVLETIPSEYIAMSDIKDWLSNQIPKTFFIRPLTKLVQLWLNVDPEVIIKHIDHIVMRFAEKNRYKFLSFVLEFLICEKVISLTKVSNMLNRYLEQRKDYSNFYKNLINSVIDKYPEELQFRPSLHQPFKEIVSNAARSGANILIEGETGVGKNVLANCIHKFSNEGKSFVPINIAALSENLIESELFGHEKGAFTSAVMQKKGKLEITDGSTVFLDEISNIPLEVQAKLLNVLDGGSFERVGGTEKITPNFRLICATNISLVKLVREQKFRRDLYYRINVIPIIIPPLRDTPDDIDMLTAYFIDKYGKKVGKKIECSYEMMRLLKSYSWEGNIRELKNCIERATALSNNGKVNLDKLIPGMKDELKKENYIGVRSYKQQVRSARRKILIHALTKYKGNKSMVAKSLDISRTRVYKSIKELDIKSSDYVIS